jgi:uncharacterized repeat protein (TIGR02543 family)
MATYKGQTVTKYENFEDATLESGMTKVDTENKIIVNSTSNPIADSASLLIDCIGKTSPAYINDSPNVDHLSFLIKFRACSGLADWGGGPRLLHLDNPGVSDIFVIRDEKNTGTNIRQLYCDYFRNQIALVDGGLYSLYCNITKGGQFAYKFYNEANELVINDTSPYTLPDFRATSIRLGDDTTSGFPVSVQIDDYVIDTDAASDILPYATVAETYNVVYNLNSATGGSTPSDSNEYSTGSSATILNNTGRLTRTRYRWTGWNTLANGTGTHYASGASITIGASDFTLYAEWSPYTPSGRQIGNTNYNPSSYSDSEIDAAKLMDVYLEHASVGAYVVGGINTLRGSIPRYTADGITWSDTNDFTWFNSNNGLGDNNRGNPGSATKISGFASRMTSSLSSVIDIAGYKFCYVDYPADGASLFDSYTSSMSILESLNPNVIFFYCTMPLLSSESYEGMQRFNDLLREYCTTNNKPLYDIADIESHNSSDVLQLDANGRELLTASYTDDGGHPNNTGSEKLALGYWALITELAINEIESFAVTFNSEGGSSVLSALVYDGALVSKPTDPIRSGYEFAGWYKEEALTNTWNFNTDVVTTNTILYAKWTVSSIIGLGKWRVLLSSIQPSISLGGK